MLPDIIAELRWQRPVLLMLFMAAFMLYFWNAGRMWRERSGPANMLAVGFLAALLYLAIGQIKAAAYDVPIDLLTYFGALVAVTIITALALLQRRSRRHGEA